MAKEKDVNNAENMPEEVTPEASAESMVADENKGKYIFFRQITFNKKPGYILRKVGQAYMIMPTGPRMKDYEGMITLNETGAFLFKELDKPEPSRTKLMQACIDEYSATPEEAAEAVDSFAQQCANCGLLETEEIIFDRDGRRYTKDEFIAEQNGQQQ